MRNYYVFTFCILSCFLSLSQNIDYNARITQFNAGNCSIESGNEEHTWNGWLSDNINTAETYSGCITRNYNGSVTQTGTYAYRAQNNTTATQLRARLDAWEDDRGSRCVFDADNNSFTNDDDCRVNQISNFNFTNPLEYQYTSTNVTVGSNDYDMRVFYQYRYSTTTLSNATEYSASTLTSGGNRPFWGSRGNWAYSGSDCAASGTITHNQTSSFSTTVSCKSQVSFRWRVSSEANFDFLRVYVNGVEEAAISGTIGWVMVTLPLDYGSNTVEWRYVKDGSTSIGLDRGFVDNIAFTNATSLNPGSITGGETFNITGDPLALASDTDAQVYSATSNYQWQYSNDGTTGWTNIIGATIASYDPPVVTSTQYYRRRVQDECGNTGYSNILQVEVLPQFVYDSGSWDPYDPGTTGLPSNNSHSVIIRENTIQTNSFTTGNLIIDSGITFTVSGDVGINVTSQVHLNGVLDLGEGGQLIQTGSSTLTVGVNGELRKTRHGNPNLYRYTYWGSPVSNSGTTVNSGYDISSVMHDATTGTPRTLNFTADTVSDGIPGDNITPATISSRWLYAFRNQTNDYSNWEQIMPSTSLLSGQGFTMKGTQPMIGAQPYVFLGTPNNGNITLGITANNNYLISNPYPSAIDAHQFLIDNSDLGGTLYFWEHYGGDTHQLSGYEGGYATYNFSGGVGAPSIAIPNPEVSSGGAPSKIPGRYIPVAQGFFVEAIATGSFTFNNNQRVYVSEMPGQSEFLRTSSATTTESVQLDVRAKIRLGMTNPDNGHRQILLTVDPEASYDVDKYYDGLTYEVLPNDIAFYLDNEYYGIQGVPSINSNDEIPLVVDVLNSGIYNIGLDQLENWDQNQDVYLYDSVLGIYYDLRLAQADIYLDSDQYVGRFSLRFSNSNLSTATYKSIEDVLAVYQPNDENRIVVQLNSENYQLEEVSLFDIDGRTIITKPLDTLTYRSNSWFVTTEGVATGAYIIKIKVNETYITKKLIIK